MVALWRTAVTGALSAVLFSGASVSSVVPVAAADADSCTDIHTGAPVPPAGDCADVLAQEERWLTAITDGDIATVEEILAPTFTHIDADGRQLGRTAEIASLGPLPFSMNASEQQVYLDGATAVIHGVNTIIQDGQVLAVERFTDVFVRRDGGWKAVSAQETAI